MIDERSFYSPTLRLKEGEIVACANVTRDAKPYIAPVFVAAPPKDRDPEKRRPLTDTELIRENGLRVARAWGNLPCMLDVRFLAKRLAIENAESWIPSIFEEAARSGAKPGVVVNLAEAHGRMLRGYAAAMQRAGAFVAIRVTLADLQMPELETRLSAVLGTFTADPRDSVAILDFAGAYVSDTQVAADVFIGAYERVTSYARWRKVVLATTSYPETNPAPQGGLVTTAQTARNLSSEGEASRRFRTIGTQLLQVGSS